MVEIPQPPTEAVLGAPLQTDDLDDETIVWIRNERGERVVLKRYHDAMSQQSQ